MNMRIARRFSRDQEGSALVEGTLLVPFLFLVVFGVYEFSNYFYQQHLVSTGVRDAARFLARTADPNDAAMQTTATNLAVYGNDTGSGSARVSGWVPGDVSIAIEAVANPLDADGFRRYRGGDPVQIVRVTGGFTYVPLGFMGFLGISPSGVTVTHRQRVISETPGGP